MSWGDLNRAFHSELYNASKLKFHLEVIDNAMNRIDRYYYELYENEATILDRFVVSIRIPIHSRNMPMTISRTCM